MTEIRVVEGILKANDALAESNARRFAEHGVRALNFISSPGAGKTTLLERTLEHFKGTWRIGVIEGDIATSRDAERIQALGAPVVQINTQGGCHLDANMVGRALENLPLEALDVVFIENVGNLVCPVSYKLGEEAVVAVLSIAEGQDKPAKYPALFRRAETMVLNKLDLAPYCDVDVEALIGETRKINPKLEIIRASCRTGEGLEAWYAWLERRLCRKGA
ncbi:MAG: hydrogenase nickel incorporation protein HypB [Verrucomicrobia bacterium]|nr:hydrogenase nickel incorporation protein HypB [Verrucomicrobiota bacterium]